MFPIKGKEKRIVSFSPFQTETVETDLFLVGVFYADGTLFDYARAGRPGGYRVYQSLRECANGIRGLKRWYRGKTLRPVRILTGELVEDFGVDLE